MPTAKRLGWFRCLIIVEAILLLVAAGLKGWLVATDSFADIRFGYPFSILLLSIGLETVVGVYLLFGRDLSTKWLILAVLFSLFLIVSVVRYLLGISDCGCLGAVEIPRLISPVNSLVVLLCLIVSQKRSGTDGALPIWQTIVRFRDAFLIPTTGGALFAIGLMVAVILAFPFVHDQPLVTRFLGQVPLQPVRYWAGDLKVGVESEIAVPLKNGSMARVTVIGSKSSCDCLGLSQYYVSAEPSQQFQLSVRARPRKPGFFHQRIVCFVDHPEQDRLTLDIVGNAVMPQGTYSKREN